MFTTITAFFASASAWILAHKMLLLPIVFVMLVLKLFAWLFRGFAVVTSLLLKPDPDAHPRPLRPKGLGMKYFVGLNWNKAREMYIPKRRF
jgi:hypothetical protein